MVGADALELHGERGDLQLEIVDQPEADVDVAPPRVGDLEAVEQLAAGEAEEVGDRAGSAWRGRGSSASCDGAPGAT